VDTFKILIWNNAVRLGLSKLFAAFPFLSWWPLSAVITHFAFKLTDFIYEETELFIDFQRIFFRNRSIEAAYVTASVDLLRQLNEKGENSHEFIEAREYHKKALAEFIAFEL
jgi:hypothetical protein